MQNNNKTCDILDVCGNLNSPRKPANPKSRTLWLELCEQNFLNFFKVFFSSNYLFIENGKDFIKNSNLNCLYNILLNECIIKCTIITVSLELFESLC